MKEEINEELFALKYELNCLAEVLLKNESERWVPGFLHEVIEHDHLERYKLAMRYANGKRVLDIACGAGKGSFILKELGHAESVLGCDIDSDAIRFANHRNSKEGLVFQVENAESFLKPKEFDLIVSFETIEHLSNYDFFL